MPEGRFTILITGPFPAADIYPGLLPGHISLEIVPFIRTAPLPVGGFRNRIGELSRIPVNAIFTSSEAVRVVKDITGPPLYWTYNCTPGGTESLLCEWAGGGQAIRSAPDAAAIAEEMLARGVKKAVFFCGDQRRDILPGKLRAGGIELEEITVYETIATPVRITEPFDAALFFSPSAVTSFLSLNRLPENTAVFALGKTTADALQHRITNPVIISEKPEKIFLLHKAIAYAHAHLKL